MEQNAFTAAAAANDIVLLESLRSRYLSIDVLDAGNYLPPPRWAAVINGNSCFQTLFPIRYLHRYPGNFTTTAPPRHQFTLDSVMFTLEIDNAGLSSLHENLWGFFIMAAAHFGHAEVVRVVLGMGLDKKVSGAYLTLE